MRIRWRLRPLGLDFRYFRGLVVLGVILVRPLFGAPCELSRYLGAWGRGDWAAGGVGRVGVLGRR